MKIEQQEEYLECWDNTDLRLKFGGAVYKDHFVVLKNSLSSKKNALGFLNLRTNSPEEFLSSDQRRKMYGQLLTFKA